MLTTTPRIEASSHAIAELVSIEPATGLEVWRGLCGDVDDTVARARRAWAGWAAQPLSTRIELVRRFANELRKDAEPLALLVARETGKPLWDARGEIDGAVARVEVAVRGYAERTAQRRLDSALQGTAALRHKPHGVMAVITSFDLPAEGPVRQIVPALIAGNAVILKPSPRTPATAEAVIRCIHRAGIPASVAQLLVGDATHGRDLAAHEGVDGILFSGSSQVGLALNRRLAAQPGKVVALELGGNSPIVVWDTPKIADAAALVVQSAFTGAGQRAAAARRLIVRDTLYDAVVGEVQRLCDSLIVGAPLDDPAPFMGPVIDNDAADGLTESFVYLMSHGGRAIRHLLRPRGELPFLSPALIDVTGMADRPDVELFGPILQIVRVGDFDEALAVANATRFGLAAALVGGTPQDYNRFWAQVRAGVVNWNRPTHGVSPASPMGGLGLSGNQRPGGFYTADHCAYPVSSAEIDQPRASIGIGLKP